MSVTFTKGAVVVTVRSYQFPYRPTTEKAVASGFTEGGDLIVEDLGADESVITYQFRNLTTAQHDALKSFWENTVDGPLDTFTFTDIDTSTYTARWMDTVWDFQEDYENSWSGQITLRNES